MRKPDRRRILLVGAGVVLAAGIAAVLMWGGSGGRAAETTLLFEVKEGPLTISVSEPGTIKNRDQVVLKCEVEGRTSILFLAKEGTQVKAGDPVVELDSKAIEDQRASQAITVTKAEASFINARENLAVVKSQAESDVAKAELDLKFAELDLKKYNEGDYPASLQQAETDITIADQERTRAGQKLDWSRKLHEKRYLSLVELQADELAYRNAELELALAQNRKQVLENFSHKRDLEALESAVGQAKMALDRVQRKAAADVVQADADLRAKEQEFIRQKSQLDKLESQLKKTKIIAPVDGMVVYATTGQRDFRQNEQPLAEGSEVRERQELIYLPTAQSMLAEVKVHESSLKKVQTGMRCRVTVDAVPGRAFGGKVARIAVMPDAVSYWMNPDLKVYTTEIHLDEGTDLRAGMSCNAEIIVETYEKAVYVPIQCVVRENRGTVVYKPSEEGPVAVPVEVGLDNNRMVRILSGLSAGEVVLQAPPFKSEAAPKAEEGGVGGPPKAEPPKATPAPEAPPEKTDWRSMTPEERKKRMDSLTPEQRQAMMEEFRKRREGGGGGSR